MSSTPAYAVVVREATQADAAAIQDVWQQAWGGPIVVSHGVTYDLRSLPTDVAIRDDGTGAAVVGALAYVIEPGGLEVVAVSAITRAGGVGSALLAAALARAEQLNLPRLWLITTNDNIDALRFYQRRGLRIVGVAPGAADTARRAKSAIDGAGAVPQQGDYGIDIHDEITLERRFD
ncbi:MAG: GNAT family N-acetyltransferase [Actinobacteria bacterium]|nr:GNAT family N-acetyltransferase [Actinomycetota bacterium]